MCCPLLVRRVSQVNTGLAERLEAGTVMINETLFTHACPETPWGGVKKSGIGRVHSDDGLRDLCIPYHVNEETIPTAKWSPFWQPYNHKMYRALLGAARALLHSDFSTKATGAWGFLSTAVDMIRHRGNSNSNGSGQSAE